MFYPHIRSAFYPHIRSAFYPHIRSAFYPHIRSAFYPHIRSVNPLRSASVSAFYPYPLVTATIRLWFDELLYLNRSTFIRVKVCHILRYLTNLRSFLVNLFQTLTGADLGKFLTDASTGNSINNCR